MMLFQAKSERNKMTILKINGLVQKIVASLFILILCLPLLGRSLWVDEAMLFSSYPLQNIIDIFRPLPYYDQAATPFYSVLMSLIGNYEPQIIRGISLFIICLTCLYVLLKNENNWILSFFAALTMTIFINPLVMLSELKHYGFEVVGSSISIMWFLRKEDTENLTIKDVLVLLLASFCGISTIVISSIAFLLFLINKYIASRNFLRSELLLVLMFFIGIITYYFLIKEITAPQISNYSDAYSNNGIVSNVKSLLVSVASTAGTYGLLVIALSLAILINLILLKNNNSILAKKIIIISFAVGFAFLILAAIGLYPAKNARHVTWGAAFFWVFIFFSFSLLSNENHKEKFLKYMLLSTVLLFSAKNTVAIWRGNFENTENNQAIAYLKEKPAAQIGLWSTGQPVIAYYSKIYPELNKHKFFGFVNAASSVVNHKEFMLDKIAFNHIEKRKMEPGGWSRRVIYRILMNQAPPARSLISEAPKKTSFFIFASHYELYAKEGFSKPRVDGLHLAMQEAECEYSIDKEFKNVYIYKVFCPEAK